MGGPSRKNKLPYAQCVPLGALSTSWDPLNNALLDTVHVILAAKLINTCLLKIREYQYIYFLHDYYSSRAPRYLWIVSHVVHTHSSVRCLWKKSFCVVFMLGEKS